MLLSVAMAVPTACTSRALRCLSTSAASCSPSVSSRIAARCAPLGALLCSAAILTHPVHHHLRDLLGVFLHELARHADLLLVRHVLDLRRGDAHGILALV